MVIWGYSNLMFMVVPFMRAGASEFMFNSPKTCTKAHTLYLGPGKHGCRLTQALWVLSNRGVSISSSNERVKEQVSDGDRGETGTTSGAGSIESKGNLSQLGQQVSAKFTPLSPTKSEAFMYTHTQMQPPTSARWREMGEVWSGLVKRRQSRRYFPICASW